MGPTAPTDRLLGAFARTRPLTPAWRAVRLHRKLPSAAAESHWGTAWVSRIRPALREASRRLATAH